MAATEAASVTGQRDPDVGQVSLNQLALLARRGFLLPDRDSSLWKIRNALGVPALVPQHALNGGVLTLNALVIGRF